MHIYRTSQGVLVNLGEQFFLFPGRDWNEFINRRNLHGAVLGEIGQMQAIGPDEARALQVDVPVDGQEVWASGVTYLRSREARMEESKDAGGGDFY
jgi:2-dehydro-3-deoxy-D-arabinonate dehydratase